MVASGTYTICLFLYNLRCMDQFEPLRAKTSNCLFRPVLQYHRLASPAKGGRGLVCRFPYPIPLSCFQGLLSI